MRRKSTRELEEELKRLDALGVTIAKWSVACLVLFFIGQLILYLVKG